MRSNAVHPSNLVQWVTHSPTLAITLLGIVLVDIIAIIMISRLGTLPIVRQILMNALIITALIGPLHYFLSFEPLLSQIGERERAEAELWNGQADLELQVQERNTKLIHTVKQAIAME